MKAAVRGPRETWFVYLVRCAEALGLYDPQVHGTWQVLTPGALRQRILRLSLHIAFTQIASSSGVKSTDWLRGS